MLDPSKIEGHTSPHVAACTNPPVSKKVEGHSSIATEEKPSPTKEGCTFLHEHVVSTAACTDRPAATNEQVVPFNSTESNDVKVTSVVASHHDKVKAGEKSCELQLGKGKVHPPPDLDSHSLELSASTLLVLADLAYDLFPSGILDRWISPECNQSVCTDIYLTIKYSSKKQWLDFFQIQEDHTQRALFHSSSMQSLLLTRASRAEGVS